MQQDPLVGAVYQGIKQGIIKTFEADLLGSALILIYTGIDAMAWLNMPANQTDVTRRDFTNWVATYFSGSFTKQVSGEELYSARCAVVHTYTVESGLTRRGTRMIGYKLGGSPPVDFDPSVDAQLLILEMGYLKDEFFRAIDQFLMSSFANSAKRQLIDQRAQKLMVVKPFQHSS